MEAMPSGTSPLHSMPKTKRELEPDFLEEPESYDESVCSNNLETQIVDVDKDLNQIFGFRDSCTERIPSFPEYLDNSSSSLSRVCRTRPIDDVGSVSHYSDSSGVEGIERESMLRAVAVLDQINSADLIDVDKLYRLIGISIARPGFVNLLVKNLSFAKKVEHGDSYLELNNDSAMKRAASVRPSSIDTDTATDLLCTMNDEKMISKTDFVLLVDRVVENRILVSYLLCNVSIERKAEMLPAFLRVIEVMACSRIECFFYSEQIEFILIYTLLL